MKNSLKVYRAQLTVLGPVFIGNGAELSKKEYIFLNGRKTAGIIDMKKFYSLVSKKGLRRQFEDFMLDSRSRLSLGNWIREYEIRNQEVKSCLDYVIDSGDTVIQRGTPVHIMECIKDPYGMPYIPGSSIKGMLRTVLLNGGIAPSPEEFLRARESVIRTVENPPFKINRKQFLAAERNMVEETQFYTLTRNEKRRGDAVNDMLAGMIVSDSEPLEMKDMVLCQKIERHTDGTEKRMNLLRECIRPGTKIHFDITMERNICPVQKENILSSIERFNEVYYDCFLSKFRGMDRPLSGQVYLGGGAGFVSKTFIYPLLGERQGLKTTMGIFQATKVPREHKHNRDLEYGVSPHIVKCTRYQGQCLEMGKCRLEIS